MLNAGGECPKCKAARLRTRSSHPANETHQVRYLECQRCDFKTKAIVPVDGVWRRSLYGTNKAG